MSLVTEHISALVVRIDTLCRNILTQLVPFTIKLTNVDLAPITNFWPWVAGVTDIRPLRIGQAHPGSI